MAREIMSFHEAPVRGYSAMFEDDGTVAYGYLLKDGKIVADLWLYNRGTAPAQPEWETGGRPPFRNPAASALPLGFRPADGPADVTFDWQFNDAGIELRIGLRGELLGVLRPGSKPGWARLAREDSPVAHVWPPPPLGPRSGN